MKDIYIFRANMKILTFPYKRQRPDDKTWILSLARKTIVVLCCLQFPSNFLFVSFPDFFPGNV